MSDNGLLQNDNCDSDNLGWIPECTGRKYAALFQKIKKMRVRDKRHIFQLIRHNRDASHTSVVPLYGISAGQFSFFHVLADLPKRRAPPKRRKRPAAKADAADDDHDIE